MFTSIFEQLRSKESFGKKIRVLFYDRTFRNLLVQMIFSILMIMFLWYLVSRALELDLGFSHLRSRAGFGLSHTFLIDYTSNDSRWQAYFAGIINTIRVSIVGILLATLLGVIMGLARLSKNFLISKIAAGYVEFIRNTPLLVQIIFWQLVLLQLPQISNAITFGGLSVWSNRGILLPFINSVENGSLWFLVLLISLIFCLVIRSYLNKIREENTNFFSPNIISLFIFIGIGIIFYFILGIDLYSDIPTLEVNQYGTYIYCSRSGFYQQTISIHMCIYIYVAFFLFKVSYV